MEKQQQKTLILLMKKLLSIIILTGLFVSCTNKKFSSKENTSNKTENNTSIIVEKIKFNKDTISKCNYKNYNYSYFIPKTAKLNTSSILILFDPQASGETPVKKYKNLATEFNVILIASNNSKNGLQQNEYLKILNNVSKLCNNNFNKNELSVCGFSGGGKVASLLNIYTNTKIQNLITAGAGLGYTPKNIMQTPDYISFVGNEDFNLPSIVQQNKVLNSQKINNLLYIFHGKHEWPDSNIFRLAFYQIKLKNLSKNDKTNLRKLTSKFINECTKKLKNVNNIYTKHQILSSIIFTAKNYTNVSKYKKQLQKIESSKEYKEYLKKQSNTFEKEQNLKQNYAAAIATKPAEWWKNEIKNLNKKAKTNIMYLRVVNYLSLACYMYIDNSIKTNNISQAKHLLEIYEIIDPGNPDIKKFKNTLK